MQVLSNHLDKKIALTAALIFLASFAVRFSLIHLPLQYDEGAFVLTGYLMQHKGYVFYLHLAENKPPLLYALTQLLSIILKSYSLLFYSRLLSITVSCLTIAVIFLAGCRLFNYTAGVLSALILLFDSFNITFLSTYHISVFVTFFELLAVYHFLEYMNSRENKQALLCGIATGLALATKQSALFVFPVFLAGFAFKRREVEGKIAAFSKFFLGGIVIILSLALIYVFLYGSPKALLDRLLLDHITHRWHPGIEYPFSTLKSKSMLLFQSLFGNPLMAVGVIPILGLLRPRRGFIPVMLSVWVLSFFTMLVLMDHIWDHYLMELAAPLSLLAGNKLTNIFARSNSKNEITSLLMVLALIAGVITMSAFHYSFNSQMETTRLFSKQLGIADYLRNRTSETDSILVFGFDSYYLLSERYWPEEYMKKESLIAPHADAFLLLYLNTLAQTKDLQDLTFAMNKTMLVYVSQPYIMVNVEKDDKNAVFKSLLYSEYSLDRQFEERFGNQSGYLFLKKSRQ